VADRRNAASGSRGKAAKVVAKWGASRLLAVVVAVGVLAPTVAVLASAPAAVAATGSRSPRVVTWSLRSRFVDPTRQLFGPFPWPPSGRLIGHPQRSLRVRVFLPAGYDGRRRFPVLYLLHGAWTDADSWLGRSQGDLLSVARGLHAVVVMPDGGSVGFYTDWWNGGALRPGWESFHLDELISTVQRRLRIRPARRWHAIAGWSMGAYGAIYYASQRPGYFGTATSFSGPLDLDSPVGQAIIAGSLSLGKTSVSPTSIFGPVGGFYWRGHDPVVLAANLRYTRVLVTSGDGTCPGVPCDMFSIGAERLIWTVSTDFALAARAAGVPITFRVHHGGHKWFYPPVRLREALRWGLFHAVPEHPTIWTYRTVEQHASAFGIKLDFARPPTTIDTFHRRGPMLTGAGAGTVTVHLGRWIKTRQLPFAIRLATQ
jgi:S-formylglutathione hydrolase FrmB